MSSLRILAVLSAFVVASALAEGFWPHGGAYGGYGYGVAPDHGYGYGSGYGFLASSGGKHLNGPPQAFVLFVHLLTLLVPAQEVIFPRTTSLFFPADTATRILSASQVGNSVYFFTRIILRLQNTSSRYIPRRPFYRFRHVEEGLERAGAAHTEVRFASVWIARAVSPPVHKEYSNPTSLRLSHTSSNNKKSYGISDNFFHAQNGKSFGILSFASTCDYLLIFFGTLFSVIHGAGFPLLSMVLGGMTTVFLRAQNSDWVLGYNITTDPSVMPIAQQEFDDAVGLYCLYYLVLGVLMFISSYIQIACWESVAERLVHKIRKTYLKAILRQQISWFDLQQTGHLTSKLTDDLERFREGFGDKMSLFIQMVSAFFAGFAVGFFYNWQMALVMLLFTPLLAATGYWMGKTTANRTHMEQEKYAVAGAIAEETFSSMRTVISLNGQKRELTRYEKALEDARKTGLVKYCYMGIGFGITYVVTYASYALAFWFGSRLVISDPNFDRGSIFTVFFAVMTGSTALGGALPHLASISMGKGASRAIMKVINTKPKIDPYSNEGIKIGKLRGEITLEDVSFTYPLREDITVLNGVSLKVSPGQKIALVGASGCGKSTIVNLLLRFYDPVSGKVTIDGHDLRNLNVRSLREAIGIVNQEPILFDGTLEENIVLGREGATHDDVVKACHLANAMEFIQHLPEGLNTRVGERGVQMSGGQKQRIAIARALIKNPQILLLDEATSALDTESESIVQKALDQAQEGRTTIIVAHRLSTIRDVDQILVFKAGNIVESGTHEELMQAKGIFHQMTVAQQINQIQESQPREDTADEEASEGDEERSDILGSPRRKNTEGAVRKYTRETASVISAHSTALHVKQMQDDMEKESVVPSSMTKIFLANRESWGYLALGLLGCCISGTVPPFFSLVYSQIFSVFSESADQLARDAVFWSAMFIVLGLVNSFGFLISANMLGRCGEAMTKKLRYEAFKNLLRQDVGFYDDKRHNTGKLCTRFATDVPNVRYVFTRLPVVVSSLVTLFGALGIGFYFGWQLALILLAIIPLILASGYFELQMKFGKQMRDTKLLEEAGKVASEAVENIRTVHSLNRQHNFHEKYCGHLQLPYLTNLRSAHIYAGVFAFSQSLMFFMYALAFWLGSIFVNNQVMMPIDVYRVFFAIAFCGQSVGQISSFIPDVVKARLAASLIFHLIEYPTQIDSLSESGIRPSIKGAVQLRNLHFSYPTRRSHSILRGLNLTVDEGATVALVGYSGHGKSTVMGMLERFYEPLKGSIFIDGLNIRDINIHSLREQIAIVSQEPTLFNCSIAENIVYGLNRAVSHEDVVRAAQLANIHNFILGLPHGYETNVGEKGAQLSGGQKQRIAIARALVRDPAILLLDEATSALDTESEKVVQEALENARRGRTCLVIAHRLSTIQNSDLIVVINEGKVLEKGTHYQLMDRDGIYKSLCEKQKLIETS
uniref:ABC-type xenobiotic transporter n=1 Tax=Steinernema glaseri TaxID=37863 RepID=A0A1I8APD0_9BILA